jgi:multimeric flavodoxin WrbA
MEKAVDADVIVCGSPIYCGYPTAGLRAFMERLIFPAVNYSDFGHPVITKPKRSATIFTMNCPNMQIYKDNAYDILMDTNAQQLGMFGPTEILYSFDTYQFGDYSRYDTAMLDEGRKAEVRRTQFPQDLERAYELGKRLVIG